jgi:AraC-like DNA-binding protein
VNSELRKFIQTATTEYYSVSGSLIRFGISATENVHIRTPGSNNDQFVITWILSGRGSFYENGRKYKISDMSICLRRPGHDYHLYIDDTRSIRLFFDIPNEMYPALTILIPELDNIPPVREISFRRELIDEFMSLKNDLTKASVINFYNFIPRLVHYILNLTGVLEDRNEMPLIHARNLLEDTSSNLTLDEIAESCGLNYNTFRKQFTATFGITPGKYRINCRIEAAKNALAAGKSVTSIADELGFSDIYAFTRRFTAVVGKPPAKYRDENFG